VYLAESLVTVRDGYALTGVLNTTEEEVSIPISAVKVTRLEEGELEVTSPGGLEETGQGRYETLLTKLRTEHLNTEEKKGLEEICFEYQDVFFLPGDRLRCTSAAEHTIHLEPGTVPINTHPYRLPESQRQETDRQVTRLLEDSITTESTSPWNSPILVVPKKAGVDGAKRWRLVADFRRLNEKTIGDAHPLPDITEILDQIFYLSRHGDGVSPDCVSARAGSKNCI
jgi:hypothetical protein